MRKIRILWIVLLTTFLFSSCSEQSSPRQVVTTFWTCMQTEKYDEAINLFAGIDELFSNDGKGLLTALLITEAKLWGTITDFEIVSVEKIDSKTATVSVKVTATNVPHPLDKTFNVRKIDGKWFIDYL